LPYRWLGVLPKCLINTGGTPCNYQCRHRLLIRRPGSKPGILLKGNVLLDMPQIPDMDWAEWGVDRLVWHTG
jgi:hypothetical protein